MSRVVIVGYRGSGKSVVGSLLAARLGYGFVDADLVLQARAGITIAEMFATQGEPAFRALESRILTEYSRHRSGRIMSLALGVVWSSRRTTASF